MPDSLASGKGQMPAIRNRDFWYVINYEDHDNKTFLVTLDGSVSLSVSEASSFKPVDLR